MQDDSALDRAVAMVADLRNRCAWDKVQTRETLRPYLIEEAHELDAAIRDRDVTAIRNEVGDLMLHLAWQLVLGRELGEFTADDIADDVVAKMRRRHPHLFDLGPAAAWATLKQREHPRATGMLEDLPGTLPSLLGAYRLQQRAADIGFDWPDTAGPAAKVREELAEVEQELAANHAGSRDALADELGDLLFACVNLARKSGVEPGAALDGANEKFRRRFARVEAAARAQGVALESAGLQQLDVWWEEAKRAMRHEP